MVALARAMADVKAAAGDKPSLNATFSTMAECFAVTACNNREMNVRRREQMRDDFGPTYKAPCRQSAPITKLLFGDAVEDEIKE
jgi:hypothetical protein